MKTLIIIEAICIATLAIFGHILISTPELLQGWMYGIMSVAFMVGWFAPDFYTHYVEDNDNQER